MQIAWRRGPNGGLETFFGDRWQPVDETWLAARQAAGHTLVEQPLSPGSIAAAGGPLASAFGQFDARTQTIRAPDGATLAPSGEILSRPATQATGFTPAQMQQAFAPDGAQLSPQGAILSLPGQTPVSQQTPPAATPAATNVDPGANWDYSGRPPVSSTTPTKPIRQPQDDLTGASVNPADVDRYMGILDRYARGGMVRKYAEGGDVEEPPRNMTLPGQEPNAIVGEGMESDNPEFDKPQRLEIVLVPTGKASTFTGYWSEGPVATKLAEGTLITPVPNHLESVYREQLLPITAMPAMKEPSPEEAMEKMTLPEGAEAYAGGGMVPYGGQTSLEQRPTTNTLGRGMGLWNDPYQGLTNTGFGSVRDYARASEGATERRNQLLILGGRLGGAQDELGFFRRMAPGVLTSAPIYG